MRLVLFDIDGTLIGTGGAGLRAMRRTFERCFDVDNALQNVPVAGRTDLAIVREALAASGRGLPSGLGWLEEFRAVYCALLAEELESPSPRQGVLPGVVPLLEVLAAERDVAVALLTGNFSRSARIKLEHFGVSRFFDWGAFGDEAIERTALLPIALARARDRGHAWREDRDVIVIGDTPHDIECARVGGATAIAVATGPYGADALRAHAPAAVFGDLTATGEVVARIRRPAD